MAKEKKTYRLTPKQRAFIREYIKHENASKAARLAKYKGPPNVVGARLLASSSIQQELGRLRQRADQKADGNLLTYQRKRELNRVIAEDLGGKFESPNKQASIKAMEFDAKLCGELGKDDDQDKPPTTIHFWLGDPKDPRTAEAARDVPLEEVSGPGGGNGKVITVSREEALDPRRVIKSLEEG